MEYIRSGLKTILVVGIVFILIGNASYANHSENAAAHNSSSSALLGKIIDSNTGEPLGWTQVLITEWNRSATGDGDGEFQFFNLPGGIYTVKIFRAI